MTNSAEQRNDEVLVDDEFAADLARKGVVSFRPGDRVRLVLVEGYHRSPEANAAFDAFAGQFEFDDTTASETYKEYLSEEFAKRYESDQA